MLQGDIGCYLGTVSCKNGFVDCYKVAIIRNRLVGCYKVALIHFNFLSVKS